MTMPVAALDIGSNSFNLLIADLADNKIQQLHRVKQRVQLGAGLDADHNLSQQAIDRGMQCLRDFLPLLNEYGVSKIYSAATNTMRLATNRNAFIHPAETLLMHPVEVISGDREAQYIYQAIQNEFQFTSNGLIIDIGGGSTEFAQGKGTRISLSDCYSVQAGCVSYSQFFADGQIYPENVSVAIASCQHVLETIAKQIRPEQAEQIIGTSGTIQSIALVLKESSGKAPDTIRLGDLEILLEQLIEIREISEIQFTIVEESRQRILPAGLCILIAIMKFWQIEELAVGQATLCEGLLLETLD